MFSMNQRQLSLVSGRAEIGSPVVQAALRRAPSLASVFGHLRLSHPPDGHPPAERALQVARELAWSVPHVAVLSPSEIRFRLGRGHDAARAVAQARALAERAGAATARVAIATSPLVASLASRGLDASTLDHAESLELLDRVPVRALPLGAGARILLAAARVRTLLELASAAALPALDEIERCRVPAARAVGLVPMPAPGHVASFGSEQPDERVATWAWIAVPLLRHAASARSRAREGRGVQLRVRLGRGDALAIDLGQPAGSVRARTDALALAVGQALRRAELGSPIVGLEVLTC